MHKQDNSVIELNNSEVNKLKQLEIKVFNSSKMIYGVAYVPECEEKRFPLVIISHGLGDSYISNKTYAEKIAINGIAVYSFDFCGGGGDKSDGKTTEMSVMTEVSDLEAVLAASKNWEFVDLNRIILLGHSQGGVVSAITAARHPDEIFGLILLTPAFSLTDLLHKKFQSIEKVPNNFHFLYIDAGKPYVEDIWNYDVYQEIGKYKHKVLLFHGSADDLVPIDYSNRAVQMYHDSELCIIKGAGHEFEGDEINEVINHVNHYFKEIKFV